MYLWIVLCFQRLSYPSLYWNLKACVTPDKLKVTAKYSNREGSFSGHQIKGDDALDVLPGVRGEFSIRTAIRSKQKQVYEPSLALSTRWSP